MRSAPSVVFPVLRSRRVGVLMAALWCLGALPVTGWLVQVSAPLSARIVVIAWTLLAGVLCARHWRQTPADRLAWDGQSWSSSTVFDARLMVSVDLQSLLVLRLISPDGRAQWLMADRAAMPAAWHTLRCAVTAARPEQRA